ncbi:MAG TPA: hypothetical protein DCF33_09845 [Saprospirales bacterium]|nr:hypothetical protein [Saprospirales bacterium]
MMKTTLFQLLLPALCLGFSTAYANADLVITDQKVTITTIDQNRAMYTLRVKNIGTKVVNITEMKVDLGISRYRFDDNGAVIYDQFATVFYTSMRMTSLPPVIMLQAGQAVDIQAEISEPNLFRSRFWLSVDLNSNGAVLETDYDNNKGFGVSENREVPPGKPDLKFASNLVILPINSSRFAYQFLLLNDGNATANLSNMEVTTELSVSDRYQVPNREQYIKMRYDSPPNPTSLKPGQATPIIFKLLSGGVSLPGFYLVRVTLNTNHSVSEFDESNNSKEANSIGLN